MLRLDFSRSDLNLPVLRTKTRQSGKGGSRGECVFAFAVCERALSHLVS